MKINEIFFGGEKMYYFPSQTVCMNADVEIADRGSK